MKSNVCKIEKGTKDLEAILRESEKVAVYNELDHKQTLQLRLICEEVDGMLPSIVDDFQGDFWIEFEDGICKVNVSIKAKKITAGKKEELIGIAKNKKNAAAVGVVGKIRCAIENFFTDDAAIKSFGASADTHTMNGPAARMDYSYFLWSMEQYKNSVKEQQKEDEFDELEKSIIANLADDVIVGVKGKQATIVVIKKFQ